VVQALTRDWTLHRDPPNGQVVLGTVDFDHGPMCAALERLAVMIPEGRYRVMLTPSARAAAGTLWAPYPDHRLPELLRVPGRTAIRLHAGNHIKDSEGCILVAADHTPTELEQSRPALTRVVNELRDAERDDDDVWLTVKSA
jgi:hypothetical protein